MTLRLRRTLDLVGDYLRWLNGLDLSGDLIAGFVQGITHSRACFGSSGGGVSVQQNRLGGGLRESGTNREI
jgi:hypothetical protein